jgi:DNA primase
VGWQARLLRKAEKGEPKYLTSPNLTKNKVLYNLDTALLYNTVVLVEGVFDVWRIGDMAVCPFGHSLSPAQMLQMQTVFGQNGGCLIMLDSDANQEAFKLANRLHEAKVFPRGIVPVYTYDNKDPDDRSPDELRDLMTNAMRALVPCRHAAPVADLETLLQGFSELEDE